MDTKTLNNGHPRGHFVVFYNGEENRPESEILRLSDCFERHEDEPELELTCRVYNINPGFNSNLLSKCPVLKEYMFFVEEIRQQVGTGMELGKKYSRVEVCFQYVYLTCQS